MDMAQFIIPKSDQLNADDLIAGPRTVRITKVSGTGNADQPVAVYFDGDGGRPYKPCKGMRRVMVSVWSKDASQYIGRSMTLFRNPKVLWGGMEVGGIQISHMSNIDRPMIVVLTISKTKRVQHRVEPLATPSDAPPVGAQPPAADQPRERIGDPSDAGGSGGSAWDKGVGSKSPDRPIGLKNPATGDVRYFGSVNDWCSAIAGLVDAGVDGKALWEANKKIYDALRDRGDAIDRGNLDAARDYALSEVPLMDGPGA